MSQAAILKGADPPERLRNSMILGTFIGLSFQLEHVFTVNVREYDSRAYIHMPIKTFMAFVSHKSLI